MATAYRCGRALILVRESRGLLPARMMIVRDPPDYDLDNKPIELAQTQAEAEDVIRAVRDLMGQLPTVAP